jgi:hypothetical protein
MEINKNTKKSPWQKRLGLWWRDISTEARFLGWSRVIYDRIPYSDRLSNVAWWVRWRTTDVYHKVDTGLRPGYYDKDCLMLHSCFALLKDFVEKEYDGPDNVRKKIEDYLEEDRKKEPDDPYNYLEAVSKYKEVLALYDWWVNEYPKYDDDENDPYTLAVKAGKVTRCGSRWDEDENGYLTYVDTRTDEQDLFKQSMDIDEEHERICQDNLLRLVKLRGWLYT